MTFIVFAWMASILYATEVVLGKFVSKHTIKNPWTYNFVWALFITLFTAIAALVNHVGLPKEFIKLGLATIFYELTGIFYVLALYGLDISILSPLFNIRTVFSVLLAAVLLHEVLTPLQYGLIGLLFVCGVLLTVEKKLSVKSFFKLPILFALCAMLSISFMGVFIKQSIALNGFWETNLWINVIGQIALLCTVPLFKKSIKKLTMGNIFSLAIIALLGTVATLMANRAYQDNVSISSVILSIPFSMICAVTFSLFRPHVLEHNSKKIYALRFLLAFIMIVAALQLSK